MSPKYVCQTKPVSYETINNNNKETLKPIGIKKDFVWVIAEKQNNFKQCVCMRLE